ncbi:hypothetical protein [Moorella sp. E306M]|uniref:hypothetical protein n=1 Tax=Moorella sp. E306M TaxID=2572683 RepID=UPI0010FFB7DA|nr:hypothetical protein [Moorella sp. E306M]GEA17729.1 hypothetical protein E306M_08630 [Moorella sp. E306M]GEA17798.1 hypothetical protein E306M_09320 [Moorella sp. E306M]
MLYSFKYNGIEYVNFDLDDFEVIQKLIEKGIPLEVINTIKNSGQPPTLEERVTALEEALLTLVGL